VNGLSKGGILVCEECGLKTVLDEPLSAYSSGDTAFGCRCGEDGNSNAAVPLRQERPASVEPWIEG
jgi:vacuolar-type H+-ATPase catalytic subunit A/Vma1